METWSPISPARLATEFAAIARAYRRNHPNVALLLVDRYGNPVGNAEQFPCAPCGVGVARWRQLVEESLRWGEPYLDTCPEGHYLWAVPLTNNSELCGGVVAAFRRGGSQGTAQDSVRAVRAAAHELLEVVTSGNLANAALLRQNRQTAAFEASKAVAIHGLKERMYTSVREMYLREEAPLLAAIRARDRRAAREVLNRILVGVYAVGTQDLELLKAVVLEFIVVIYRAAVEAGGDPVEMLGLNYQSYLSLFRTEDEEHLAHWLVEHLERLMDCLELEPKRPPEARLQEAVRYMREHFDEDLGRDQVAALVGLSPSHFSRLLREHLDTTFHDMLNDVRRSRACELLTRSEMGLAQIAQEVGFADQSYFTKVFHKRLGATPKEYRISHGRRSL